MKAVLISTFVLAATTIAPVEAAAQRACGERGKIVERLAAKYGESRQSMGLNHNNGIVEVFASSETGTWTILITMPDGRSCLMAAGEDWEGNPGAAIPSGMKI